jgi:methionine-gamma-lyase
MLHQLPDRDKETATELDNQEFQDHDLGKLMPREAIQYLSQDTDSEPLEIEEASDSEVDRYLQETREYPFQLRLFITELAKAAQENDVLPTMNKVRMTEDLVQMAKDTLQTLPEDQDDFNQRSKAIAILILKIISTEEPKKDEYLQISEKGEVKLFDEIFDEILRLKITDGGTWDPEESLRNARREFGEFGGVNPSTCNSTTFTAMSQEKLEQMFGGELGPNEGCFLYARNFNPTNLYYGMRVAAMQGMEAGYPTATGMAAINVVTQQILNPGDKMVSSTTIYGGTRARFENFVKNKLQVKPVFVNPGDTEAFLEAITPDTKMVYIETEANPTLTIADITKIADKAHEVGAKLVVDNTFSEYTFSPAKLGADVVVSSATKFLGGRSDSMGGIICSKRDFILETMGLIEGEQMLGGGSMDPKTAAQFNLYLNDLGIRVREHSKRALEFATRLEERGAPVTYPGLESHPQHELAKSMMNEKFGFGGMMGIRFKTHAQAKRFVERYQQLGGGLNAVSLGYSDSLVSVSGVSTSSEISDEDQMAMGLTKGYTRISIGYEGTLEQEWSKLWRAVNHALEMPEAEA